MRLTLVITALAISLLSSCGKVQDPVFMSIENVRLKTIGLKGTLMTLDMQYYNPNKTSVHLKEAEGEAWLDSSYLGRFYVDTTVRIPANSNFTIPVKLNVEMIQIMKYSFGADMNKPVPVRVNGTAKVKKFIFTRSIPLSYLDTINLGEMIRQKKVQIN